MPASDCQSALTMKLFALLLKCPMGEETDSCPFATVRSEWDLETKFQVAEIMASRSGEHENLYTAHEICFRSRLQHMRGNQQHCRAGLERSLAAA